MKVHYHEKALIDYFLDPGKENLHATFMKNHNVMYDDTAKISVIYERSTGDPGFKIEIGNGNHYRDFDQIQICERSGIVLIDLECFYAETYRGWGTIDVFPRMSPALATNLKNMRRYV